VVYSIGLRLGEALNLKIGDIDKERMKVHIRMGKGNKARFVILPQISLMAMRKYWSTHRNPSFIFPAGKKFRAASHSKTIHGSWRLTKCHHRLSNSPVW
jgi:integrase/recombinase XerD